MMCVVTPTGDRPEAFELCVRYMNRQTLAPDRWFIVDDGRTDAVERMLPSITVPYIHVRLQPMAGNSLVRNLRAGFGLVPDGAAVCVMEDDDWYPPTYLETMARLLSDSPVVASRNSHYYNIPTRQYRLLGNKTDLPMHGNGFSGEGLVAFKAVLLSDDSPHIDSHFSKGYTGKRAFNDTARPIHITGFGSGRPGTTNKHALKPNADGWTEDPDCAKLYEWIGTDVHNYAQDPGKVYVISNVAYPEDRKLQVNPDDLLVFLNTAASADYYGEHTNKVVYHRSPKPEYGEERLGIRNRYVFDAGLLGIPDAFIRKVKSGYDWNYQIEDGKTKSATTGYMVAKYMEASHPTREIVLVNFGYDVQKSTYRCPWHNWMFEANELKAFRHVFTADLRKGENPLIVKERRNRSAEELSVTEAFTAAGSDRMISHDYGAVFTRELARLRGRASVVAEIGGVGVSGLKALHAVLPEATVYGLDRRARELEAGIATLVRGDGYAPSAWASLPHQFDLIIDDGTHRIKDMLRGIPTWVSHLAPGGVLLIEDVKSDADVEKLLSMLDGAVCERTTPVSRHDDDRIVIYRKPEHRAAS